MEREKKTKSYEKEKDWVEEDRRNVGKIGGREQKIKEKKKAKSKDADIKKRRKLRKYKKQKNEKGERRRKVVSGRKKESTKDKTCHEKKRERRSK